MTGPCQWESEPSFKPKIEQPAEDIGQFVEEQQQPVQEPIQEPAQEGPSTKRRNICKILGEFSLVQGSAKATPKSNPVWKDRLKETGLSSLEFNRALQREGLVPYMLNGGHLVQDTSSHQLIQRI